MTELKSTMQTYAKSMQSDIESAWARGKSSYGEAILNVTTTEDTARHTVTTTYKANGQRAWIMEYGRGKDLDKDSPYWKRYQQYGFFNEARRSSNDPSVIRGRKEDERYTDLDGNDTDANGKPFIGSGSTDKAFHNFDLEAEHVIRNVVIRKNARGIAMREAIAKSVADDLSAVLSKAVKGK